MLTGLWRGGKLGSIPAAAKSLQSCPTLCDPIDGCPPGFPTPGVLQARILEWVAISFSRDPFLLICKSSFKNCSPWEAWGCLRILCGSISERGYVKGQEEMSSGSFKRTFFRPQFRWHLCRKAPASELYFSIYICHRSTIWILFIYLLPSLN